jgi:hypothetical protein
MTTVNDCVEGAQDDKEVMRKNTQIAGAAIAQFLVMRDGLRGRVPDAELDATAATLTAAVYSNKPTALRG